MAPVGSVKALKPLQSGCGQGRHGHTAPVHQAVGMYGRHSPTRCEYARQIERVGGR